MKSLQLKQTYKRWVHKLNALPQRDRIAMLAGGLALITGLEFQAVMPVHDRRVALMSVQHGADPLQLQNEQMDLEKKRAKLAKLQQELAQRPAVQAGAGQSGTPREVFASLRKAMALQEVEVVTLKALPDEAPVKTPAPTPTAPVAVADAASAVADAASQAEAAPAVAPAASAEPSVYRHRAVLKIAGAIAQVNQVLTRFEQGNQLMRLERVKLAPADKHPQIIEATLSLIIISQEPTWLAM